MRAHILPVMTTHDGVCARIRSIRISQGLSLSDVELASNHTIRAVVLGSYERGDRALSVKKAITIAAFYGVPLSYLLEAPLPASGAPAQLVMDLRAVKGLIADDAQVAQELPALKSIIRFISALIALRNDWNGEILSMRASDLSHLAMSLGKSNEELTQVLRENRLLVKAKSTGSL